MNAERILATITLFAEIEEAASKAKMAIMWDNGDGDNPTFVRAMKIADKKLVEISHKVNQAAHLIQPLP
ncbi:MULTISPECIES: hypothetical protein [Olivibacter]|uniref:Uncharacterized protein n=1 Tax=Olivibacter jilunii TaxID=985016 RepID=A0ABW6AZW4_9SPHI